MIRTAKVFKAGDTARVGDAGLEEFPEREPVRLRMVLDAEAEEELDPQAVRNALLSEARAEAEQKIQHAYQEAYQLGLSQGREHFEASIAQSAEMLQTAAAEMVRARETFAASLEPQVVELATLIAQRVLQREIRMDPELIHATVHRALLKIADRHAVTVRVHPADLEALQRHKIKLLEDFEGVEELIVEADEAITPGGCMIESRLMQADARIETLLSTVLESLAG